MKLYLIEDEPLAMERIELLLEDYNTHPFEIVGRAESVVEAVAFLSENQPDLLLCDIQLADGLSFTIFEKTKVSCPVIFTTAFEEYALKAFKLNSIDYLLKPIQKTELFAALDQFHSQQKPASPSVEINQALFAEVANLLQNKFKTRYMVKLNDRIIPVAVSDIRYVKSEHKITWAFTHTGKKYPLDETMDQVESFIDPQRFFRVNRAYLISIEAIEQLIMYSNSRYKVILKNGDPNDEIIVSRDRVGRLKKWLST